MQAYVLKNYTGPQGLEKCVLQAPDLARGEVRVKVKAVALNHRDLMIARGDFAAVTLPGLIPGSDAAGEVVETGAGVLRCRAGDRVMAIFNPDWFGGEWVPSPRAYGRGMVIPGVLCEEIVVREDELVGIPAHLSFAEAATLPCAAVTAWSSLCAGETPMPGQSVLVQGSGGVSIFAIQFARLFGLHIIATSSSDTKLEKLQSLGAHKLINYRSDPDWDQAVLQATGGRGVDRVIDMGGADTMRRGLACAAQGGRIALVGLLTGMPSPGAELFIRGLTLHPIKVGSRQDFEFMNRAIEFHGLRPVIDRVFSFDEAAQALRYLESGRHVGKIVVSLH